MDAASLTDRPLRSVPQHMEALARANQVRLARAALKRKIATGETSAADVVASCPWETQSMTVLELLTSQRRWGRTRSRKFLLTFGMPENKMLGSLTDRQRQILAQALESPGSHEAL